MCTDNLNWILEDIAIGDIYAGTNLQQLQSLGISAVVCALTNLPVPIQTYSQYGITLLHVPIDDSPQVNIEQWFSKTSNFIMNQRMLSKKILIHCYAGRSRSVSITAAFLMDLLHYDDVKALYWIRARRPCVMVNPGFLKQLAKYGYKYK